MYKYVDKPERKAILTKRVSTFVLNVDYMDLEDLTSGEWHECGTTLMQWDCLYDMQWDDPQLENMSVACASYGGPIAMMRDSKKMVLVRGGTIHPVMRIFNCSGVENGRFIWSGPPIRGFGWTADERLLLVDVSGDVSVYDIHGQRMATEFSLGTAAAAEKLQDCVVYSKGIVGLTCENNIWAIMDFNDIRPQKFADFILENHPQCMTVRLSSSYGLEVILACEDTLVVVDTYQASEQKLDIGLIQKMTVSPDGELIAAYTHDDVVHVLNADLTPFLSVPSPTDTPPIQIAWCANDLIAVSFEADLILIDPDENWTNFSVDKAISLIPEIDCLRVITPKKHLMLRKVSEVMAHVLSTESDHIGRDLYLARQAYDAQDAKADVQLRRRKDELPDAIHACIQVACEQIDVTRQRDLLKAATYGLAFSVGFPNTILYETCQRLRILNNIRDPEVGVVMTMNQLLKQSVPTLISRLINAHRHMLASKICESMGMNQDDVLRHWACARISADGSITDDQELSSIIVNKIAGCKGVKYATIATHAQAAEQGRKNLARMLLEHEAIAADQVPLLLKLGDEQRPLSCAIDSGDTDLVYFTIFHLHKKLALLDKLHDFYSIILSEKQATDLFVKYCRAKNPDAGKELLQMSESVEGEAGFTLDAALSISLNIPDDPSGEDRITVSNLREQVVNVLKEAAAIYARAPNKKCDFQSKMCEEFAQLRKMQAHVDESMGRNILVGLSVVDSIKQCIRVNNQKAADDFKRSFGVGDKQFWQIKVKTLAERGAWDTLEAFASSKKSPIGWEPFIKASMAHGASPEIVEKFIDRLPDSEEKAEYYTRVGLNLPAAKVATSLQNMDLLSKIQGMMGANTQFGMRSATVMDRLRSPGGPSGSS